MTLAEQIAQIFLASFFSLVGLFYIARTYSLSHKIKKPVTFAGKPGSLHWLTHRTFHIFRTAIWGVAVGRIVWPSLDRYLFPIPILWRDEIIFAGCFLLFLSFSGIVVINLYMKENWRSGVRENDETELITTGPFAVSQNPMMLFVIIGQIGFFFALPTIFSLICLLVGILSVNVQVGIERRSLELRFGEVYQRYEKTTPRWIYFGTGNREKN